jgi:hypothetical protein
MSSPGRAPERAQAIALEDVVITPQLEHRPVREFDLQKENLAFRELSNHLINHAESFLDRLVELAVSLCDADTVGISVEQTDADGQKIFRWVAMAGELKHLVGGTTPRNFSPCGVCLDQNQPVLMNRLDRFYPYFAQAPLPFVEALLIPWEVNGGPCGTLWVVAHSDRRKFDRQDVRLMGCLTAFACGAIGLQHTLLLAERAAAAKQAIDHMAHAINNPLQGAMLALSYASWMQELPPAVGKALSLADHELRRVAALSTELIRTSMAQQL